ncbi:MAG TPA: M56 family metallopeptidase [Pirellulales bacterium]|nr:M56 family metallopeptidase [Pirellulales bacterium]
MNESVDRLFEPGLWFLANWSGRWAVILLLTWTWLKFLPPRRAAIRCLVCLMALLVGLTLPMMPAWELAVWTPPERPSPRPNVPPRPTEKHVASETPADLLTVPEELPPDTHERGAARSTTTAPETASTRPIDRTAVAELPGRRRTIAASSFGARRYLVVALAAVWAVGVLVGFSRVAYGLVCIRRLRRESVAVEGPSREFFTACRSMVGTKRGMRLASHPFVSSPLAVGVVRPMILVPEDWHAMSPASRRASLIHEIQHLANYDDCLALLRAVTGALFFFHPLVHWLLWRIGHESELICDDAALGAGITQRDYADLLLEFAQRPTSFGYRRLSRAACSVPFGSRRTIRRRLLRLLDSDRPWTLPPVSVWRRALLAVVCFGLGAAMSGLTLKAAQAPREATAASQPVAKEDARPAPPPAADQTPKRVPKKRPPDAASRGGRIYDTEPMPVSIQGTAKDHEGRPLPGVKIYVAAANGFGAFGQEAVLARAMTDGAGRYAIEDVMLPVRTFPPQPDVVEGSFQVFGTSYGNGFAWHGVRSYRPRPRPADNSEPDMDRAYYEGEAIVNDLRFGSTVRLEGQVMDDLGNPVVHAKVQIGVVADQRRSDSEMYRFELVTPEGGVVDTDRSFTTILALPEARLSARTDEAGRYHIDDVPRDASFVAGVTATPELGSVMTTITTNDKAVDRAESAIAHGWNPVLVAPRTVAIRTIGETDKEPLAGVVLHAYGRQIRGVGSEARSDVDGRATLKLPPGHYQLVAEPAIGSLHVRTEQEIDVGKEPPEQPIELGVASGALVVLSVATGDAEPVEGVGFVYEADSSRDRHELQSQTVFVDHPTTGSDGVLRAVVEPGRRRFFVAKPPDGYEMADGESPWIDVVAGRETNVRFELRKTPPADTADAPADGTDLERHLQDLWRRQNDFKFKGSVTYRTTNTMERDYVVTRDEMHEVMTRFDPNAGTDIVAWINQHLPELNVRLAGPYQMVIDGQKHRRNRPDANGKTTSVEVFNGVEIVHYDGANAQVSVNDHRLAFLHIDGIGDLRHWPLVPRNPSKNLPKQRPKSEIISRADGKVVLGSPAGDVQWRLVVDEKTGFVHESSFYQQQAGNGQDEFQFAPIELADGMIWARLRVELRYQRGELYTITIHDISSIEQGALPADAFAVAVPAGTLVLASDFGEAAAQRDRNQRGRPKQGMANGPVTDAVQFAYALSPRTRSLWPVIKIGQDAPALNPAAWLTADGQIEAPDLKDKVVLLDFWGQGCGPCVLQLPKVISLARQYAKTDLRIVGWHDSSGDVEGVARFARKHGLPYVLAIDHEADEPGWFGALFKSYGVRGIPQAALLDRQRKVVFVGTLSEAIAQLESVLGKAGEQEAPRAKP